MDKEKQPKGSSENMITGKSEWWELGCALDYLFMELAEIVCCLIHDLLGGCYVMNWASKVDQHFDWYWWEDKPHRRPKKESEDDRD